jgi:hypothetical protein
MGFKDAAELYDYVGGIFDAAMADDEVGPKFAASEVVLKLVYTDPDAQLVVDMPNRTVYRGAAGDALKPTVQMFMKADVGHQFWLGNVNISTALAKGQMRAKGPIPKILKLVPLARSLFPNYRHRLEAERRDDLLAS